MMNISSRMFPFFFFLFIFLLEVNGYFTGSYSGSHEFEDSYTSYKSSSRGSTNIAKTSSDLIRINLCLLITRKLAQIICEKWGKNCEDQENVDKTVLQYESIIWEGVNRRFDFISMEINVIEIHIEKKSKNFRSYHFSNSLNKENNIYSTLKKLRPIYNWKDGIKMINMSRTWYSIYSALAKSDIFGQCKVWFFLVFDKYSLYHGYASQNSLFKQHAFSVYNDGGHTYAIDGIAHELAHIMNAHHDDVIFNCKERGYIMSEANISQFSNCSKKSIRDFFEKHKNEISLAQSNNLLSIFKEKNIHPTLSKPFIEQCPHYGTYNMSVISEPSNSCEKLICSSVDYNSTFENEYPLEMTICNYSSKLVKGKYVNITHRCIKKKCVEINF